MESRRGDGLRLDQAIGPKYAQEKLADALVGGRRSPHVRCHVRRAAIADQSVDVVVGRVRNHEVPAAPREHLLDRLPGAARAGRVGLRYSYYLVDQRIAFEQLASG